jgi:RNA polymerase sigma factor (TIGR02999 family)
MDGEVTQLLDAIAAGHAEAADRLLPLVYDELRRLARRRMAGEAPGQTLDATALVHEAYLRLVGGKDPAQRWQGRGHFFAAAAEALRRILVDNARRKRRLKRGGGNLKQALDGNQAVVPEPSDDLLALDEALDALAAADATAAQLVKLRYFAGMTLPEAAEALGVSTRSADRVWAYAKAWLRRRLSAPSR